MLRLSPKPDPDPDPDPMFSSGFGGSKQVSHQLTTGVAPKDFSTCRTNWPLDEQPIDTSIPPGSQRVSLLARIWHN